MTPTGEGADGTRARARFPRRLRLKQRRRLRPLFARAPKGRPQPPEEGTAPVVTAAAGVVRLMARRSPAAAFPPGPYPMGVPLQVAFIPGRQPSAVVRNRVRRILREVYRVHHGRTVGLAPFQAVAASGDGLSLAVLLRGAVTPRLHADVARDLPRALSRLADALAASPNSPPSGAPASSHNPPAPAA